MEGMNSAPQAEVDPQILATLMVQAKALAAEKFADQHLTDEEIETAVHLVAMKHGDADMLEKALSARIGLRSDGRMLVTDHQGVVGQVDSLSGAMEMTKEERDGSNAQ